MKRTLALDHLHFQSLNRGMSPLDDKPHLAPEFIDFHAIGMVKHLQKSGFETYLVGGCIRDLMCGHYPKDYDIGTNARPEQIKRLLHFAFIIGKRFRLVLVRREERQYELATFRREPKPDEFPEGVPFGDNIFGSPEEDAKRRDFTCNALFYDPVKNEIIDFVDGKKDIENRILRMIGDPAVRLREDPIRILRALRLAHKLDFKIEPGLRAELANCAETLPMSVLPRRREEFFKILRLEDPARALHEAYDLGLFPHLASELSKVYDSEAQVELFEDRINRMAHRMQNPQDTALLAGALILGYLRATRRPSLDDFFTNADLYQNPHLDSLMQTQLGLHNWETAQILKALSLFKTLSQPDDFFKRGHRRRMAFLASDVFPLALELAQIDGSLDPQVLGLWEEELEKALLSIGETDPWAMRNQKPQEKPKRRRRSPRKPH